MLQWSEGQTGPFSLLCTQMKTYKRCLSRPLTYRHIQRSAVRQETPELLRTGTDHDQPWGNPLTAFFWDYSTVPPSSWWPEIPACRALPASLWSSPTIAMLLLRMFTSCCCLWVCKWTFLGELILISISSNTVFFAHENFSLCLQLGLGSWSKLNYRSPERQMRMCKYPV